MPTNAEIKKKYSEYDDFEVEKGIFDPNIDKALNEARNDSLKKARKYDSTKLNTNQKIIDYLNKRDNGGFDTVEAMDLAASAQKQKDIEKLKKLREEWYNEFGNDSIKDLDVAITKLKEE